MHKIECDFTIIVLSCVQIMYGLLRFMNEDGTISNIGALLPNYIESSLFQCEPSSIVPS